MYQQIQKQEAVPVVPHLITVVTHIATPVIAQLPPDADGFGHIRAMVFVINMLDPDATVTTISGSWWTCIWSERILQYICKKNM